MEQLEIGIITKPQGLKGEIRVKLYSNDFTIFNEINYLIIKNTKYKINKKTNRNTFVVLKLEGVNDIDTAESLKNISVFVNKSDISINEDDFFVNELIGYEVFDENGVSYGTLTAIQNFGASDVYTIKKGQTELLFANARGVITKFDNENKKIIVDSQILSELSI